MMACCYLCASENEEFLLNCKTIDQPRRDLVKSLLRLADLKPKNHNAYTDVLCAICEKDLDKLLARVIQGHRQKLPSDTKQLTALPILGTPTLSSLPNSDSKGYLVNGFDNNEEPNPKSWTAAGTNDLSPRKRVRRPPERYREDETIGGANLGSTIQISIHQKHFPSSLFSSYPKVAELRNSNNTIGDLVEVQCSSVKHPRLRILCRECPEAYTKENEFIQHFHQNHTNREENHHFPINGTNAKFLYFCTLCGKDFQEHFAARKHFKQTHSEERPYQCSQCPLTFQHKRSLDVHIAKHFPKNHECPQCLNKFYLRSGLQKHLKIHTRETPFNCQICSKAFSHRSSWQKHEKTHRSNTKSKDLLKNGKYIKTYNDAEIPKQLSIDEISNHVQNNLTSEDSTEFTEEFSKVLGPNFERLNNPSQSIAIEETETNGVILNTAATSDMCRNNQLHVFNSFLKNTNTSISMQSATNAISNSLNDTSLLNTTSIASHDSNNQKTKQGINIKSIQSPFIKMLPKNLKIIKIIKTDKSKLQAAGGVKPMIEGDVNFNQKVPLLNLESIPDTPQWNKEEVNGGSISYELSKVPLNTTSNAVGYTQINEEALVSNHFHDSAIKTSDFKSNTILKFNTITIEENNNERNTGPQVDNFIVNENMFAANREVSLNENKCVVNSSDYSIVSNALTKMSGSLNECVRKSPLRVKMSHNINVNPILKSKPVITNIEILPKLNFKEIQRPLPPAVNADPAQYSPACIVKMPADYKFQCSQCWKYFNHKSALAKHMRTHSGEKPYRCHLCPKSYADASNFKKHKLEHIKAAEDLNKIQQKPPLSPALSSITDPDPDGIEVMQTIQPFELTTSDADSDDNDDMETYLWQDAFQHSLMSKEIQENIRSNLKAIMPSSAENY